MVSGLLLALSLGAGVPAPSDQLAPPPVALDVVVTDAKGQRVKTLTAADFTIIHDGERIPVASARFVESARTPPASSAGDAPSRLFAILLDDFHITPGAGAEAARAALIRFVRDDLGPLDRVVVLRPLDSLLTISLTADRRDALAAVAAFEPRRGDYAPRTEFERNFIAESPARAEATRARIVTSAMTALAMHLGQFAEARKSLIVVSEGFVSGPPRREAAVDPTLRSVAAAANRANVAVYTLLPDSESPRPQDDDAMSAARAALRRLAVDTGGLGFETPDLRPALLAAEADASGFYVLTFTPSDDERGGLGEVTVGVAGNGLTARAQRAYGRRLKERVLTPSPLSASFLSAYSARFPRRSSPLIRPWFGLTRRPDGGARVSFIWEPAPRVPGDRTSASAVAKIELLVTTLDGESVYQGPVLPAIGSVTGAGDGMRAIFDAPTGRLLVQMSIEDLSSRVVDRDVRDVVVGGFPGPVSLGTVELLRARNAREQQLLLSDPNATPVASRQFSRRERLIVRVPVYSQLVPSVSARLRSAYGSVMRELNATPVSSRSDLYQVDLSLASFAAGGYSLDIEASTSEGHASEQLTIRLTP